MVSRSVELGPQPPQLKLKLEIDRSIYRYLDSVLSSSFLVFLGDDSSLIEILSESPVSSGDKGAPDNDKVVSSNDGIDQ